MSRVSLAIQARRKEQFTQVPEGTPIAVRLKQDLFTPQSFTNVPTREHGDEPADSAQVQSPHRLSVPETYSHPCENVYVESDHQLLPVKKMTKALLASNEFPQAKLAVTGREANADVMVRVYDNAFDETRIFHFVAVVVNRANQEKRVVAESGIESDPVRALARNVARAILEVCNLKIPHPTDGKLTFTMGAEERDEELRAMRSIAVESSDFEIDEDELQSALHRLPMKLVGLSMQSEAMADGVALVATEPGRENGWKVEIVSRAGKLLAARHLIVIHGQDVPRRLALTLFSEFVSAHAHREPAGNQRSAMRESTPLTATVKLQGGIKEYPQETKFVLSVEAQRIQISTPEGKVVVSIPANRLEDVAGMVTTDPDTLEEDAQDMFAHVSRAGEAMVVAAYVTAQWAMINATKHRYHFLDIAWDDGSRVRTVSFEVPRSDARKLWKRIDGMIVAGYPQHHVREELNSTAASEVLP